MGQIRRDRRVKQVKFEEIEKISNDNAYGKVKGRIFDSWITGRSTGYSEGNLINTSTYIYESIIRDELRTEIDLVITTRTSAIVFTCNNLLSSIDNYYTGAIYYNVTTGARRIITNYVGSTKTIEIELSDNPMAATDNFYITNIGGNSIDNTSFDVAGNTTNGTRKDWKFARSIFAKQPSDGLLDRLLFESHCTSFNSGEGRKIVALDSATGDVLTQPLYSKQRKGYIIDVGLTSVSSVFTDFTLYYFYNYGSGDYLRSVKVNKDSFSDGLSSGATLQAKCRNAEINYRVKKKWEYSSNWIYNDATAGLFLNKMVPWLTFQRLLVNWGISIADGIKYEFGDQVFLAYDYMIPDTMNNYPFIIYGKKIITKKRAGHIVLKLMQMPDEIIPYRITKDRKLRVTKDGKRRTIKRG